MAKSVFQEFVKAVRTDWKTRFPWIQPVPIAYNPAMPKASTFYVGAGYRFARHLFLNIQYSSKSWAVGDFTVNVLFSSEMGAPTRWIGMSLEPDPEGSHRIGSLLYRADKWWCLRPTGGHYPKVWRPVSYADSKAVIGEAVEDLSRDVSQLFEQINQRAG